MEREGGRGGLVKSMDGGGTAGVRRKKRRGEKEPEREKRTGGLAEEINNGSRLVSHVHWYTLRWKITYDTG